MKEIYNNKIEEIRNKVIDYYGTAMPFNPMALMDLNGCSKMTDEEILEEAIKLKIISKNDLNNIKN